MIDVLLFAKAPRPGFVKTRLAASVGEATAVRTYRELGRRVIGQIAPVSRITVWFDPPDALSEMQAWLGEHAYRPQVGGDLGHRLSHALADHFSRAPDRPALAIGADAPGVTAETIQEAAAALRERDVVIGPAHDGGYYLVGMCRCLPELFVEIPWGTHDVFTATVANCHAIGIRPAVLPVQRDVDTIEDLQELGLWPS